MSGYTDCACRDCFEIAISSTDEPELCNLCEDAGCDADGEGECCCEPEWDEDEDIPSEAVSP